MFSTDDGNGNYDMGNTVVHTGLSFCLWLLIYTGVTGGANEIWA
jgi:hypothetical protein